MLNIILLKFVISWQPLAWLFKACLTSACACFPRLYKLWPARYTKGKHFNISKTWRMAQFRPENLTKALSDNIFVKHGF